VLSEGVVVWSVPRLEITVEERSELERRVRAHTSTQRMVKRARIVLLAADAVPNRQIANTVAMSEEYVGVWRRRFERERFAGLEDRPRPGRPRVYDHDDRLKIIETVTATTPQVESQWSHRLIAETLADELGISASQVGRILADLDVKPHLVRGWLTRPDDPAFAERAMDVCGLYLRGPDDNALVLSVDEKTAIPARSRRHPTRRCQPGQVERREFEYRRHGTACLMAALNVHTGEVLAADAVRNDADNFIAFLDRIDVDTPHELTVHLVLDNGASHVAKKTRAWLAAHPRFVVHHTPKHASWLNQVELFFSILTRKLLRRGEFTSRADLVDRIMAFIGDHNRTAKPFAWTYDGSPLKIA
jgi:transposase